jgi:hypothetical protein
MADDSGKLEGEVAVQSKEEEAEVEVENDEPDEEEEDDEGGGVVKWKGATNMIPFSVTAAGVDGKSTGVDGDSDDAVETNEAVP